VGPNLGYHPDAPRQELRTCSPAPSRLLCAPARDPTELSQVQLGARNDSFLPNWTFRVNSAFWKTLCVVSINYWTFGIMCSRKFHSYIWPHGLHAD
jgi:hypothetical protein